MLLGRTVCSSTESLCLYRYPGSTSEARVSQRAPDRRAGLGSQISNEKRPFQSLTSEGRWDETHNDRNFCSCHPALVCLSQTSTQSSHSFRGSSSGRVKLGRPRTAGSAPLIWSCYGPVTKSCFWQGCALRRSEVKRSLSGNTGLHPSSSPTLTGPLTSRVLISPQTCSLLTRIKSGLI